MSFEDLKGMIKAGEEFLTGSMDAIGRNAIKAEYQRLEEEFTEAFERKIELLEATNGACCKSLKTALQQLSFRETEHYYWPECVMDFIFVPPNPGGKLFVEYLKWFTVPDLKPHTENEDDDRE